jgi:hypothetical protein
MPKKSKTRVEAVEPKATTDAKKEKRRRRLHPSIVSATILSGLNRN